MDKKEVYERAEKALQQAFEAAKQSVKVVSEKAGEAAHITKLMIEKATLEYQVNRQFAQLGSRVYKQALKEGKAISFTDTEIKEIVDKTRKLDTELTKVEASLEGERQTRKAKSKKVKSQI